MLLSKIDTENMTDEQIQDIVYQGISDDNKSGNCILVFGNPKLVEERVGKAVELHREKRAPKIMFMGGVPNNPDNKKWDEGNNIIAEAIRMKNYAIELGIPENDILVETESGNSIENIINTIKILESNIGFSNIRRLILVSSEFHLKRCLLIAQKYMPGIEFSLVTARDGQFDIDNWNKTEEGDRVIRFEANLLTKLAREEKIADIEVQGNFNERKII